MDKSKRIKIVLEGPYILTGGVPVKKLKIMPETEGDGKGSKSFKLAHTYQTGETCSLCRCGHSSSKPFCDGTHMKNGFIGKETASRLTYEESARVYEGEVIDMLDRVDLCAVARFCDVAQGAWKLTIMSNEDNKLEELAIYEASSCPSGRLTIRKNGLLLEPDLEKEIGVLEDVHFNIKGPLFVQGGIIIEGSDGVEYEVRNRATLCRCGESKNMPFCDASHLKCPHMRGLDE
jgi:CDGSH-type Zn-finger protein